MKQPVVKQNDHPEGIIPALMVNNMGRFKTHV